MRSLLPWYAAGALERAEAAAVEAHLHLCSRCAQDLQVLVRLRGALHDLSTSLPSPSSEVLDRTWMRILRYEREHPPREVVRLVRPLVALAAAVGMVMAGIALRGDPLVTLGVAREEPAPTLQVVFHPRTPEEEIRALLQEIGGTIAEGPRASGLYRIRLRRDVDPEQVIRRLRREGTILFVEREP
ncbi:MAG: zf-HC2 domain-containing protein [Armatimonadetes bacterium]|nr:zf-HC2 domain-containing protein [Armatimonadota bacterium]MDW8154877.1 zf-HC2 domain-containing protein [Armatimonadota bacterium]